MVAASFEADTGALDQAGVAASVVGAAAEAEEAMASISEVVLELVQLGARG